MEQKKRREWLIRALMKEDEQYAQLVIPDDEDRRKMLLRGLMNVRPPMETDPEIIRIQDEYLQEELRGRGIMAVESLTPVAENLYLWQGDITTLRCGAIVNAANSGMTGCYHPNHRCIDNAIHTFAGMQLRCLCNEIMELQGYPEPTGSAKITPAFNLPCEYVIHTVGPIVTCELTEHHKSQLNSCYSACLEIAERNGVESIAFCCISTGEFRFPNREAAEIAVASVRSFVEKTGSRIKVIFNVFKDVDYEIYRQLLCGN